MGRAIVRRRLSASASAACPAFARTPSLTPREQEVLTRVAQGRSAWKIGEILKIGHRTAEWISKAPVGTGSHQPNSSLHDRGSRSDDSSLGKQRDAKATGTSPCLRRTQR